MTEGNCLCGSVTWELTGEPYAAYNCHCVMCQKIHGTPFGTYYFVRPDQFRWTSDTDSIIHYRSSHSVTRSSCDVCGSVVPHQRDRARRSEPDRHGRRSTCRGASSSA